MNDGLKFIESFGKLELKEGDIIVLKTSYKLSQTAIENLHKSIRSIIPKNIEVMVLEEGMDIGILRRINE